VSMVQEVWSLRAHGWCGAESCKIVVFLDGTSYLVVQTLLL